MQFSKMNGIQGYGIVRTPALAFLFMAALASGECRAESAYVAQIPGNVVTNMAAPNAVQQAQTYGQAPSARAAAMFTPESGTSGKSSNFASTLEIGSRNSVYTLQSGSNNTSNTGVIGNDNNVTVLQAGNNLKSNVVLMNGSNMNVSVIQPRGSAPVNVFIARLPGGGLLIKR
jgi:hypothetical protein